ncbi:MAG: glycine zipper domain-containing protein [Planctomycetota bacterium]
MRTACIYILLAALIVGGCASGKGESYSLAGFNFAELDKVAILEVTGAVSGDTVKNQIGTYFEIELMKRGYSPIVRSEVQALLKEKEFQASDITSSEGAAKAGQVLNVPAVMIINIPKYEEEMSMTAKLINVEDARILWIGEGSGTTGKTFSTFLGAAAGAAVGVAVGGGDSSDRVAGGIIGGVLGGVAGQALSPQQEEQVKKIIKIVCEEMPARVAGQM